MAHADLISGGVQPANSVISVIPDIPLALHAVSYVVNFILRLHSWPWQLEFLSLPDQNDAISHTALQVESTLSVLPHNFWHSSILLMAGIGSHASSYGLEDGVYQLH